MLNFTASIPIGSIIKLTYHYSTKESNSWRVLDEYTVTYKVVAEGKAELCKK